MIERTGQIVEEEYGDGLAEPAILESAALVEVMAQRLGRELERRGAGHWRLFCTSENVIDLDKIVEQPGLFGEKEARWDPLPLTGTVGQPGHLWIRYGSDGETARESPAGLLWLEKSGVAMARWMVWDPRNCCWDHPVLVAAESIEKIGELHRRVAQAEREEGLREWQVLGAVSDEGWSRDAHHGWEDVVLPKELRNRLEDDVVGFFTTRAKGLYASLGVPYRRGVLLYGPPGNGKTSIIRVLGAALPQVATMTLQPHAEFDDDDLRDALRRWIRNAPAMLVIEDIDSIFESEKVHVSKFLNMLDGIGQVCDGGLLLVATTNHPEQLDPAINNRPGRFDVVVEIPSPGRACRSEYLTRRCGQVVPEVLDRLVDETDGMSFAHLAEILQVSGLRAIRNERDMRIQEDWLAALEAVKTCNQAARSGFELSGTEAYGFAAGR
ncbi:MAG: ATP-binding protein [Planctomycetota bacterium]|nr:ATP-binding protein [Planctomycetota bacterium]